MQKCYNGITNETKQISFHTDDKIYSMKDIKVTWAKESTLF